MASKVVVLANKWWEVTPLVSVLQHARAIKPEFSGSPSVFEILEYRQPQESGGNCARLKCLVAGIAVEVWCLEDLIPNGQDTSSSFEKERALRIFDAQHLTDDSLALAFGTAAAPSSQFSGNVVVGSRVFVVDARTEDGKSEFVSVNDKFGQIVTSAAEDLLHGQGVQASIVEAEKRFLKTVNNPAPTPRVFLDPSFVSVGVLNVSDTQDYETVDRQALEHFQDVSGECEVLSVETTHGLIRLTLEKPFLYFSGISNEVGSFREEVRSARYAQSFVASHNAAICLAWMLPTICEHWQIATSTA